MEHFNRRSNRSDKTAAHAEPVYNKTTATERSRDDGFTEQTRGHRCTHRPASLLAVGERCHRARLDRRPRVV